jgi:membrane-associated protease RseP (regulator of RpoE activity)
MTDIQDRQPGERPLPPPPPGATPVEPAAPASPRQGTGGTVLRLGALLALIVLLGVAVSWWAVVIVLALLVMIFLHELGHFVAARRAGMKVTEFFLGFGPRIWSIRRGEVEYGIKAVPLGAYVKIIGMSNLEEVDPADEDRTYRSKPYWSRFCVAVAGSAMHFAIALVLIFATLALYGQTKPDFWVVNTLTPQSPATQVGLLRGDRIVAVDGQEVTDFSSLTTYVRGNPGEAVTLTIERDGKTIELTPTLAERNPDGEPVGFLGIGPINPYVKESLPEAAGDTFVWFGEIGVQSTKGLFQLFSPDGISKFAENFTDSQGPSSNVNTSRPISPVGLVQVGDFVARNGMADLFLFLAAINIFIGIFNLTPLPPFDGGHIAVATYEAIRSRKGKRYYADVSKLLPVAYIVLTVVLVLFVGGLYLDLTEPIVP